MKVWCLRKGHRAKQYVWETLAGKGIKEFTQERILTYKNRELRIRASTFKTKEKKEEPAKVTEKEYSEVGKEAVWLDD